jgi:hypothetical protein
MKHDLMEKNRPVLPVGVAQINIGGQEREIQVNLDALKCSTWTSQVLRFILKFRLPHR